MLEFETSKNVIKNIKQSSKQIRPVTFFHQRMLRNKKSKNWTLEWFWIIKCLERKKMFDMWDVLYNELCLKMLNIQHFYYKLVPYLVCCSDTVDVRRLNFWYFFCFASTKKMACCKAKSDHSVLVLILWPKMSSRIVW